MRLRRRDLEGLLDFVKDAHDTEATEPLTTELLDRLTSLVGCEFATYQALDWQRRASTAYVPCSNEGDGFCAGEPADPRFAPRRGGLQKLSDRFDRRERERLREEEEYNAEFRVVDALAFGVGDAETRSGWVRFDSQSRDFGERERALALTLRPHVETLWRAAEFRRRAAELPVVEPVGQETVRVPPRGGSVARLTRREREILAHVAEGRTNGQIAEELWISAGTVRRHLENAYAKLGVHTRTAGFAPPGPTSEPPGPGDTPALRRVANLL